MITKVTKQNAADYQYIFDKANRLLFGDDEANWMINNINDYVHALPEILNESNYDYAYALLPKDEPTFDIDADSRAIKVPTAFKSNGISVKGDQAAEMLVFTIDRYFDSIDLANKDEIDIVIQWQAVSGGKVVTQGISNAAFRDTSVYAKSGKMLFTWLINNEITANAGTIRFAVRFYKRDDETLLFSLSTITADVTVKPTIDFYDLDMNQLKVDPYLDRDLLEKRFTVLTGKIDDDEREPGTYPDAPDFWVALPLDGMTIIKAVEEDGKNVHYVDLNAEGELPLFTVATSTDGRPIYNWYHNDRLQTTAVKDYIKAVDAGLTVYEEGKAYYSVIEVEGGRKAGEMIAPTDYTIGEAVDENVYVLASTYTATSVGDYQVGAKVVLSDENMSDIIRVPGPGELSVEVTTNEQITYDESADLYHVILADGIVDIAATGTTDADYDTEEANALDKIVYVFGGEEQTLVANGIQFIKTVEVEESDIPNCDMTKVLKVSAVRNGEATEEVAKSFRITGPAMEPVVTPVKDNYSGVDYAEMKVEATIDSISDELTYQWYESLNGTEDLSDDMLIEGATAESYIVSATGQYYCVVTNHVNGSEASVPSAIINVYTK